jgi:hypothetical protein
MSEHSVELSKKSKSLTPLNLNQDVGDSFSKHLVSVLSRNNLKLYNEPNKVVNSKQEKWFV